MKLNKRIYEDFFKKSRLQEYRDLLIDAKNKGYKMMGIYDFYNYVNFKKSFENEKIIIMRHDVDTSPRVAKKMFDIEYAIFGKNGTSTYYFRDKTTHKKIIRQIEECGYETGYHYETIANYEKKHHLMSVDLLRSRFDLIKKQFEIELRNYRQKTNTLSKTISSHGDFINTKYKIQNYELLKDNSLREKNSIILEAYDNSINKFVTKRFADQQLLEKFTANVRENLEVSGVILLLTHPRQWEKDILWNLYDNFSRIVEGLKYNLFIYKRKKR